MRFKMFLLDEMFAHLGDGFFLLLGGTECRKVDEGLELAGRQASAQLVMPRKHVEVTVIQHREGV